MAITVIDADLTLTAHSDGLIRILDEYARLPHIAGQGLSVDTREHLIERLAGTSGKHILLAVDGDHVAGVAVCFEGFSTFAAKPLLNIHDLAVESDYRGRGIGSCLLDAVAERARELGCCRITLEADTANVGARKLYERAGFVRTQEFWKRECSVEDPT